MINGINKAYSQSSTGPSQLQAQPALHRSPTVPQNLQQLTEPPNINQFRSLHTTQTDMRSSTRSTQPRSTPRPIRQLSSDAIAERDQVELDQAELDQAELHYECRTWVMYNRIMNHRANQYLPPETKAAYESMETINYQSSSPTINNYAAQTDDEPHQDMQSYEDQDDLPFPIDL